MVAALPQEPMAYYYRAYFDSAQAEETARTARSNDLTPAIRDLNRALELDPENAMASLLLGEVLQKNRNIPAAHAIFREGASLYPQDLRFIRSLAWLELVRGNAAAAMSVLEDGLKHTPDGFDLLVALADLLVQEGDTAINRDPQATGSPPGVPPSGEVPEGQGCDASGKLGRGCEPAGWAAHQRPPACPVSKRR